MATIEEVAAQMFAAVDLDGGGFITMDENLEVVKILAKASNREYNEAEARASFAKSDADHDGKVTEAEFIAYAKATLPADAVDGRATKLVELMLASSQRGKVAPAPSAEVASSKQAAAAEQPSPSPGPPSSHATGITANAGESSVAAPTSNVPACPASFNQMSKYKITFLGNQAVGKTAIINRFMYDTFDNNYLATIGIDFLSKTTYIGDRIIRLQLWDTAGQERFRSLIPSYIRDSAVAIIVFDLTNRKSFTSVQQWYDDVKNERGDDVIVVLVGNKTDLHDKRQVSTEEGESKAQEFGALFIETSAMLGLNVPELFKKITAILPGVKAEDSKAPPTSTKDPPAGEIAQPSVVKLNSKSTESGQANNGCAC